MAASVLRSGELGRLPRRHLAKGKNTALLDASRFCKIPEIQVGLPRVPDVLSVEWAEVT